MPSASSSRRRYSPAFETYDSRSSRCWLTRPLISVYLRGWSVWNARSSSSHLMAWMPSRCAIGAKISSVSFALSICLFFGIASSVRMLCRRSASLMRMTRMSEAIATIILR